MDAGIFVFDGADVLDFIGPMRVLSAVNEVRSVVRASEVRVHLVAESAEPIHPAHGPVFEPTTNFEGCPPLDVLIVPGGSSTSETAGRRVQQRNPRALAFVRDRSRHARVTASVCTGAFILAEAGLLAGKRANTHWRWCDERHRSRARDRRPVVRARRAQSRRGSGRT